MDQKVHSAVQFNTIAIIVLIIISLITPLFGYVWGYLLSLIGLVIGFIAVVKVRQIESRSTV